MTKDFSRFAPKEMDDFSTFAAKDTDNWKWSAIIGWTLLIATTFHAYVLPHLI